MNLAPHKVSALSIKGMQLRKELEQSQQTTNHNTVHYEEPFTETEMQLQWARYAQKMADKGKKIMESYMLINTPKLDGTRIIHELPNEGSKVDFETEKSLIEGFLRGILHNHLISIEVIVNEKIETKKVFSDQDRYNRLHEINPTIELLRNTFGLDFE